MKKNTNEKLNEELINSINGQKEGTAMRKNRKLVAMLTACIIMMLALAGCESKQPVTQQQPATTTVASQPTEEAKPTEVTVGPTDEATPTEVATHEPIMVDGIDFYQYYTGEKTMGEFFSEMKYDSARIVILQNRNISIVKSGDKVEWNHKTEVGMFIYTPNSKKLTEIKPLYDDYFIFWNIHEPGDAKGSAHADFGYYDIIGDDMEIKYEFDYDDGTSEEFTFYLTSNDSVEIPEKLVVEPVETTVAEPTEAHTAGENVIGGVDFSGYDSKVMPLPVYVERSNIEFSQLSIVVCALNGEKYEPINVIKDGDSFEGTEEMDALFYFFAPKTITDITCTSNKDFRILLESSTGGVKAYCKYVGKCSNLDLTCEAVYEDGSKETITVYLTQD